MPQLLPIHGIRYATRDVSTRIAPPYDVLDEEPKQRLLARDPHNIVRVDLPVTPPKTVGPDSAYAEAGDTFRGWLAEGVLRRDEQPAVYAYEQVYDLAGRTLRRRGLIAAMELEPFNRPDGGVYRHEMTFESGVNDRYKLTAAAGAQLSPILAIFPDPRKQVIELLGDAYDQREPDLHGTTDNDGVEHRVWTVDPAILEDLQDFFRDTDVFIADGHHRYTTALKYHNDHPDIPGAEACLFVLVPAEDPGLIVLPTHRVLTGLSDFSFDAFRETIAGFEGVALTDTARTVPDDTAVFGLLDPAGHAATLTCRRNVLDADFPDRPAPWRRLDVTILHDFVIDRLLRPRFGGDAIAFKYTADPDEMTRLTKQSGGASSGGGGGGRLGVLMRATPIQAVMSVARAGAVMPPKSTYFHPKVATGLVVLGHGSE